MVREDQVMGCMPMRGAHIANAAEPAPLLSHDIRRKQKDETTMNSCKPHGLQENSQPARSRQRQ